MHSFPCRVAAGNIPPIGIRFPNMLPRRLLCGLLALGFLAAAATAGAENWKQIGVDKYRNIWQVDLESVREANSFTTGWIRKLFREPQRDREGRWYSSSVEGWAVDCKARSTAITGVVSRDSYDRLVEVYSLPAPDWRFREAASGTRAAFIGNYLCAAVKTPFEPLVAKNLAFLNDPDWVPAGAGDGREEAYLRRSARRSGNRVSYLRRTLFDVPEIEQEDVYTTVVLATVLDCDSHTIRNTRAWLYNASGREIRSRQPLGVERKIDPSSPEYGTARQLCGLPESEALDPSTMVPD